MSARRGPYRVAQGGQVDRHQPVPFTFNGRSYTGCRGDSAASALLANGVRTVARSFKFHRPRGIFSCGTEEPNALLQVGEGARAVSSVRAPLESLTPGLALRSQAGWPSVDFDLARMLDALYPLWSAGFYNKTFKWPGWHTYEPLIRRLAGLGTAPIEPDPDRYEIRHAHCDVLVVGGGVAGLEAAFEAGLAGARVLLVERDHAFGGEAAWNSAASDGAANGAWIQRALGELKQLREVRLLTRTTAIGVYDGNVVTLLERVQPSGASALRERYWIVRPRRIVLATGTIEQPLIFAHNDRPGIMLAGAAREYLLRYGVALGHRVLIATNNDSAYELAKALKAAGVAVLGLVDTRRQISEGRRAELRTRDIELFPGSIPIDTYGFSRLQRVIVGKISPDGTQIELEHGIDCDSLAVSGGLSPALALYAHAGGKLAYDSAVGALWPVGAHPSLDIVGAAGERTPIGPRISPTGDPGRQWVDLLHDVTVADLQLAVRENFTAVEHVKRYTTVGMAADQGKTSTGTTLELLGRLRAIAPEQLGHTTLRPPFVPVTLGAIAGRDIGPHFAPFRALPMHAWHITHGALMQDFGEWQRPVAYPRAGETREQATTREARAVRTSAGLFDGSSLGKIEIHGPDALEFLDRFYLNDLTTLKQQRVRYGLMLRESGVIFDDGTIVMLAPEHLLLTTTSGNASRVFQWLEEWHQCEWPQSRVAIMPVTDQWATVSLTGPQARTILSRLTSNIDLSPQAFPHLTMRVGELQGVCARIYRVSFSGELTYEINVPRGAGPSIWEALLAAGAPEGLQPVGLDALLQLRLEKGFLHVGTDTDGTTVPSDIGWGGVALRKRRDYIGKRSLQLPENCKPDRLQLVGLEGQSGRPFVIGSHLRMRGGTHATDGWITSAGRAVLTEIPIALAMLRAGGTQIGNEVEIYDMGERKMTARVVNPTFFDPTGARMHA